MTLLRGAVRRALEASVGKVPPPTILTPEEEADLCRLLEGQLGWPKGSAALWGPFKAGAVNEQRVVPPPGAQLFLQDDHGRPCDDRAEDCFIWCWSGAERWLYASQHPLPPELMRGRVKKDAAKDGGKEKARQTAPEPGRGFW
jgi:hypothetical protein